MTSYVLVSSNSTNFSFVDRNCRRKGLFSETLKGIYIYRKIKVKRKLLFLGLRIFIQLEKKIIINKNMKHKKNKVETHLFGVRELSLIQCIFIIFISYFRFSVWNKSFMSKKMYSNFKEKFIKICFVS